MTLTTLHKVALLVALPVTGLLLYFLTKKNEEEEDDSRPHVTTSRQTVIEVKVPRDYAGVIIGAQGSRIKQIQDSTGARVNFKDETQDDTERVVVIRGTAEGAQQAELQIRKIVAERPTLITEEILIPEKSTGRIIGKNGDTVRHMSRVSQAKIMVDRTNEHRTDGKKKVVICGTAEAIQNAKALIEEKLEDERVYEARAAVRAANRQERGNNKRRAVNDKQAPMAGDTNRQQEALQTQQHNGASCRSMALEGQWPDHRDYLECYVSAVEDAGHFWVQVLNARSAQLDKLVEDMTSYYSHQGQSEPAPGTVEKGSIVAAPFQHDDSWYRAKVIGLQGTMLDLYYVDFGDHGQMDISQIRALRGDYLSLPNQAFECFIANIKPVGETWSDEASDCFEELTHAAKWKVIMAKTVSYRHTETGAIPCVDLIDTNGPQDIHVGAELVAKGYALWAKEEESDLSASPKITDCLDDDDEKNDETWVDETGKSIATLLAAPRPDPDGSPDPDSPETQENRARQESGDNPDRPDQETVDITRVYVDYCSPPVRPGPPLETALLGEVVSQPQAGLPQDRGVVDQPTDSFLAVTEPSLSLSIMGGVIAVESNSSDEEVLADKSVQGPHRSQLRPSEVGDSTVALPTCVPTSSPSPVRADGGVSPEACQDVSTGDHEELLGASAPSGPLSLACMAQNVAHNIPATTQHKQDADGMKSNRTDSSACKPMETSHSAGACKSPEAVVEPGHFAEAVRDDMQHSGGKTSDKASRASSESEIEILLEDNGASLLDNVDKKDEDLHIEYTLGPVKSPETRRQHSEGAISDASSEIDVLTVEPHAPTLIKGHPISLTPENTGSQPDVPPWLSKSPLEYPVSQAYVPPCMSTSPTETTVSLAAEPKAVCRLDDREGAGVYERYTEGAGVSERHADSAEGAGVSERHADSAEGAGVSERHADSTEGASVSERYSEGTEDAGVSERHADCTEGAGVSERHADSTEGAGVSDRYSEGTEDASVSERNSEGTDGASVSERNSEGTEDASVSERNSEGTEDASVSERNSEGTDGASVSERNSEGTEDAGVLQRLASSAAPVNWLCSSPSPVEDSCSLSDSAYASISKGYETEGSTPSLVDDMQFPEIPGAPQTSEECILAELLPDKPSSSDLASNDPSSGKIISGGPAASETPIESAILDPRILPRSPSGSTICTWRRSGGTDDETPEAFRYADPRFPLQKPKTSKSEPSLHILAKTQAVDRRSGSHGADIEDTCRTEIAATTTRSHSLNVASSASLTSPDQNPSPEAWLDPRFSSRTASSSSMEHAVHPVSEGEHLDPRITRRSSPVFTVPTIDQTRLSPTRYVPEPLPAKASPYNTDHRDHTAAVSGAGNISNNLPSSSRPTCTLSVDVDQGDNIAIFHCETEILSPCQGRKHPAGEPSGRATSPVADKWHSAFQRVSAGQLKSQTQNEGQHDRDNSTSRGTSPVQKDDAGRDTECAPVQKGDTGRDTECAPVQKGDAGRDTESAPVQKGDAGRDTESAPVQKDDAGRDTECAPVQKGDAGRDTESAPVQKGDAGRDTESAPVQKDDTGRDTESAPVQKDDTGRDTESAPVQKGDTGRDTECAPVQKDDAGRDTESAPVQKGDTGRDTECAPVQKDDAGRDTESAPVQKDDTGRDTESAPVQKDDTGRDTESAPVQKDDLSTRGTTSVEGNQDKFSIRTTERGEVDQEVLPSRSTESGEVCREELASRSTESGEVCREELASRSTESGEVCREELASTESEKSNEEVRQAPGSEPSWYDLVMQEFESTSATQSATSPTILKEKEHKPVGSDRHGNSSALVNMSKEKQRHSSRPSSLSMEESPSAISYKPTIPGGTFYPQWMKSPRTPERPSSPFPSTERHPQDEPRHARPQEEVGILGYVDDERANLQSPAFHEHVSQVPIVARCHSPIIGRHSPFSPTTDRSSPNLSNTMVMDYPGQGIKKPVALKLSAPPTVSKEVLGQVSGHPRGPDNAETITQTEPSHIQLIKRQSSSDLEDEFSQVKPSDYWEECSDGGFHSQSPEADVYEKALREHRKSLELQCSPSLAQFSGQLQPSKYDDLAGQTGSASALVRGSSMQVRDLDQDSLEGDTFESLGKERREADLDDDALSCDSLESFSKSAGLAGRSSSPSTLSQDSLDIGSRVEGDEESVPARVEGDEELVPAKSTILLEHSDASFTDDSIELEQEAEFTGSQLDSTLFELEHTPTRETMEPSFDVDCLQNMGVTLITGQPRAIDVIEEEEEMGSLESASAVEKRSSEESSSAVEEKLVSEEKSSQNSDRPKTKDLGTQRSARRRGKHKYEEDTTAL